MKLESRNKQLLIIELVIIAAMETPRLTQEESSQTLNHLHENLAKQQQGAA